MLTQEEREVLAREAGAFRYGSGKWADKSGRLCPAGRVAQMRGFQFKIGTDGLLAPVDTTGGPWECVEDVAEALGFDNDHSFLMAMDARPLAVRARLRALAAPRPEGAQG